MDISTAKSALPGVPCPACGMGDASRRTPFRTEGEWQLYRCTGCETVYLDPMPGVDALSELYTDAYDGAQSGYFAKPDKKLRRSKGRVRALARLAPPPGNFLDIGCNGGFTAEAARRAGYRAWGIEPDAVSISYAKEQFPDCTFAQGMIDGFHPSDGDGKPVQFDLAYCSEVIEHVPQPKPFVQEIHRLLKPGGLLYLTTPDISHRRRPADITRWDGYCPPSHCVYFTPASLAGLLQACGFTVLRRRWAWKPGIKLIARRAATDG